MSFVMTYRVLTIVVLLTSGALAEPPCEYEDGAAKCKKLCDAGSQDSCAVLGVMHLRGDIAKKVDYATAEKLLQGACTAKVALGCGALGSLYGVQNDLKRARPLFEQACTMGDPLSCESLGGLETETSIGKPKAELLEMQRRAIGYYRRACDLKSAAGCAFVAAAIADKMIPGTAKEALALYVKACSLGNGIACRQGVDMLANNAPEWKALAETLDVPRLAADLLSRGCKLGDASSCKRAKPAP